MKHEAHNMKHLNTLFYLFHASSSRFHVFRGFTLVELLVVIAILSILATLTLVVFNPVHILENSRKNATVTSLRNIANAAQMYANDNGDYAPDVNRSIPSAFTKYITPASWAKGAFPGSVYDYDNWENQTCWDGTTGNVQITLRQINGYKGKSNYTLYYVLHGPGVPHCSDSTARGECINCESTHP